MQGEKEVIKETNEQILETTTPTTETVEVAPVDVVAEKKEIPETKQNFVRNKMTVTLNKENLVTVHDFVEKLPPSSGVSNITNLLMHLITAPKETVDYSAELEREKKNVEAAEMAIKSFKETISDLYAEIGKLKQEKEKQESAKLWFETL